MKTLGIVATNFLISAFCFKSMTAVYTAKVEKGLHINPESKEALISLGNLSQYNSDLWNF